MPDSLTNALFHLGGNRCFSAGCPCARTTRVVVLRFCRTIVAEGLQHQIMDPDRTVKKLFTELAIPAVSVIHPKPGAIKNEVVLPGNIQVLSTG